MLIKPNKTCFRGRIHAIERVGLGAEIDIVVSENESDPSDDFIRPMPGAVLRLYSAEPENLMVGAEVRAEARLDGGPFGQRAILESTKLATDRVP